MISFNSSSEWIANHADSLSKWLSACAESYGYAQIELSYSFMSEQNIQALNKRFLNHDFPTDIITFDYTSGARLSGDIYIGEEVVRSNAALYGVPYEEEFCRVLIHGVLHLTGLDDVTEEEKALMRKNEDKCLFLRPKNLITK